MLLDSDDVLLAEASPLEDSVLLELALADEFDPLA